MKGQPLRYQEFDIHPEYCELDPEYLQARSVSTGLYQVATLVSDSKNKAVGYARGVTVFTRDKYKLHPSELANGILSGAVRPRPTYLGGKSVLILICYEILFPEDYLPVDVRVGVDLVIHVVGTPMFSAEQKEGWVAMQKALSLMLDCPVACCCGGERGPMNITGVIERGELT